MIKSTGNEALNELIGYFMKLPGVGAKTAQRYALEILKMPETEIKAFSGALSGIKKKVKFCSVCGCFTDTDPCAVCTNGDKSMILVVKDAKDVISMERLREYKGVYHVLGGVLSPMDNIGPENLRIKELLRRIDGNVKEVIVATNPDVEGEATAIYIAKLLRPLGVKVTRIAQGVSVGSDLEYADEITLSRAIEDRKEIN